MILVITFVHIGSSLVPIEWFLVEPLALETEWKGRNSERKG